MTEDAWSPEVDAHLRAAGWYPGRRVDIDAWVDELNADNFEVHPAAVAMLTEFGGLHVPKKGRSGIHVAPAEIEYDPTLCAGQRTGFDEFSGMVNGRLYPLGEVDGGHASLAIDESGAVYMLFANQCRPMGVGRRAVANLIEGRRDETRQD